eukprot:gnl/Spiro4/10450_TR5593_c0_g1_i1.p1 gnl/Spiro4/10450_TR5593_c0_g1~~gnl/Spiro4/10450_TR5593_c0_g1_i1.p1  ORF type:complete len:297 (+),score=80.37 gnl/Spiro4/10450_TR5593_c0_g1_i1:49-891(+)
MHREPSHEDVISDDGSGSNGSDGSVEMGNQGVYRAQLSGRDSPQLYFNDTSFAPDASLHVSDVDVLELAKGEKKPIVDISKYTDDDEPDFSFWEFNPAPIRNQPRYFHFNHLVGDPPPFPRTKLELAIMFTLYVILPFMVVLTTMYLIPTNAANVSAWWEQLTLPTWAPLQISSLIPIWIFLCVSFGLSAFIVWCKRGCLHAPLGLYFFGILFIGIFFDVLFGNRDPLGAVIVLIFVLADGIAALVFFWRERPAAGFFMIPMIAATIYCFALCSYINSNN